MNQRIDWWNGCDSIHGIIDIFFIIIYKLQIYKSIFLIKNIKIDILRVIDSKIFQVTSM